MLRRLVVTTELPSSGVRRKLQFAASETVAEAKGRIVASYAKVGITLVPEEFILVSSTCPLSMCPHATLSEYDVEMDCTLTILPVSAHAAGAGRLTILSWLISHGANLTVLDAQKRTALDVASLAGHSAAAAMLEKMVKKDRVRTMGGVSNRMSPAVAQQYADSRGALEALQARISKTSRFSITSAVNRRAK
jgi:hypothetical protein